MLSAYLVNNTVIDHASGDVELLIVQKAVESASSVTVLVGKDTTDLLITRTRKREG